MIECTRNIWGLKRCRFEPRYNEGPSGEVKINGADADGLVRIIKAQKPQTYVYDICTSCGKVRREGDQEGEPQMRAKRG